MSAPAAIRADAVNLPLFLHVLGAMLLVGALITVAVAVGLSRRGGDGAAGLVRLGLKAVPIGVLPAYVLMRVGAQWTESEQNLPEAIEDSAWLGIGYITADLGALLVIVSVVLSVIGLRRVRAGGDGAGQARAVAIMSGVLLVAYLVAVWAMSAKPD